MVSRKIWIKQELVSFSKSIKIAFVLHTRPVLMLFEKLSCACFIRKINCTRDLPVSITYTKTMQTIIGQCLF
jgi:hypothetical protein